MSDKDQTVIFPLNEDRAPAKPVSGLDEPVKSFDEFTPVDEQPPAEFAASLVSFAFIKAALRRSRRFWCITAVIGFLLGAGVYASSPPFTRPQRRSWLTPGPYENINTAANNDQEMAQSRTVAGLAEQKLGLHEDVGSFLAYYTGPRPHRAGADRNDQRPVEQPGRAPGQCRGQGIPAVPGGRDAIRAEARARFAGTAAQPGQPATQHDHRADQPAVRPVFVVGSAHQPAGAEARGHRNGGPA